VCYSGTRDSLIFSSSIIIDGRVVGLWNDDLDNLDLPNLVEGSDKEKLMEEN